MKLLQKSIFESIFYKSLSPAVIVRADDPLYIVEDYNESYYRLVNSEAKNAIGKSIWDLFASFIIGPKANNSLRNSIERVMKENRAFRVPSFNLIRPGNNDRNKNWWEIELVPIGTNDWPDYILLNLHNVSDRIMESEGRSREQQLYEELAASNEELITINDELQQSQQRLQLFNLELEERVLQRTKALEESESRFRNMMETIPNMAWTNDKYGQITFYNQQWLAHTGLGLENVQASNWKWQNYEPTPLDWPQPNGWEKIVHPDDLKSTLDKFRGIIKNGYGGEFECRFKRTDGIYKWYLSRLLPFKNLQGKIELWVGTATDIDDLKQLQQQKDDFISIASHELKTPITSLKASLQILNKVKDKAGNTMITSLIEKANKSMTRVSALIEELLNATRYNQGQVHLHKKQFNLSKEINECCLHITEDGSSQIIVSGDLDLQVYADPERISQVITNLINNAVKYARDSKEIIINLENLGDKAKVSVIDKGLGISPEKLPYLFDRYYRVDNSCIQFSGLGLGLYISAEIIRKHGGEIGVESKLKQGSTFWFTIPVAEI